MGNKHGKVDKNGELVMLSNHKWEQNFLDNTLMPSGKLTRVATVTFRNGNLRATSPHNFIPDKKGIAAVIDALNGDTDELARSGIALGSGTPVITPGKLEEGKSIFSSDGGQGGCMICKTNKCLLIGYFDHAPTVASQFVSEAADEMEKHGY